MASSSVHPSSGHLRFGTWSKPETFGTLLYKVLPYPLPILLEGEDGKSDTGRAMSETRKSHH